MTTASPIKLVRSKEGCLAPEVGSLLPDYIVDLLDDATAEKIERHLVDCQFCKERYHTILRVRRNARVELAKQLASNEAMPAPAPAEGDTASQHLNVKRKGTASGKL